MSFPPAMRDEFVERAANYEQSAIESGESSWGHFFDCVVLPLLTERFSRRRHIEQEFEPDPNFESVHFLTPNGRACDTPAHVGMRAVTDTDLTTCSACLRYLDGPSEVLLHIYASLRAGEWSTTECGLPATFGSGVAFTTSPGNFNDVNCPTCLSRSPYLRDRLAAERSSGEASE